MFIKVLLEDKYVDDKDAETCKYLDVDMGDTIPYQDTMFIHEHQIAKITAGEHSSAVVFLNDGTKICTCNTLSDIEKQLTGLGILIP